MPATNKQRFTLYLLTLLFIWVNGIAAPYQGIQNASSKAEAPSIAVFDAPEDNHNEHITLSETAFQQPAGSEDRSIYSAFPAEETFEEQEEAVRKDEQGFVYISLPEYLIPAPALFSVYPLPQQQHNLFSAVRKQSTYLLDCTFLI